ncbi:TPA: type VII secretion protein EssA [Listeria monocytogenes]|uniref:type VII secretion protein EssA n=1 Tax=Listeria monocytogenes TaxID=1639 RepID=UPI0008740652|nr:type VII secretion protein EssA [Listeria monocytogenes]EAF0351379.1 type VII secretion protein EssA [Listeria monocytogenes]EAF1440877.1 type VII secretion protein EssA [Listeria monocytogenes]EAF1542325.1 type VII secretion protein EssA [Listeria monocytogenes]ECH7281820.1 type VII secretion protein EssA [Listeria monocytogenes]EGJ5775081.1 type VII secretion protein EssA [Listeria monocytogenes]
MKFKIAAFVLLLCFTFAPGVLAADSDSYLENNGKMDIKTDRLQKTEEEKTKELEQMEETELDKNGIPLFTDEMDEKIAKQKAAEKAEYDRIKDSLFEEESTSGETVEKTKAKLFTGKYEATAVTTETPTNVETTIEDETKKTKQKTVGGAIAGTLVALAGGIYVAARNVFE